MLSLIWLHSTWIDDREAKIRLKALKSKGIVCVMAEQGIVSRRLG